jgi:hypothetical protein
VAPAPPSSYPGHSFPSPSSDWPLHLDFACHATRIVIEVDGGQHAGSAADEERTKVLEANGYRLLRYWNNDVLSNIDGVLEDILSAIATTPTPNPSPQGGGEHTERAAAVRRPQRDTR